MRHLLTSKGVKSDFFLRKSLYFIYAQTLLRYHLIQVPCTWLSFVEREREREGKYERDKVSLLHRLIDSNVKKDKENLRWDLYTFFLYIYMPFHFLNKLFLCSFKSFFLLYICYSLIVLFEIVASMYILRHGKSWYLY